MSADREPRLSLLTIVAAVGLAAGGLVLLLTQGLAVYAYALFIGVPFLIGFTVGIIGEERGVRLMSTMVWGLMATAVCAVLLLTGRFEGLICVAMAAPLAAALIVGGTLAAWLLARARANAARAGGTTAMALALVVMPGGLAIDTHHTAAPPPLHAVVTIVEIDAPPERVWPHVVRFPEMPPPAEWMFRAGVAYPMRVRLDGEGVGAMRYCEFSTGDFVEPITVWDAPRRLAFDVIASPAPMTELNPFGPAHPPHLDGYFTSEHGEFRLEALPGGRTRLIGTSWYRLRMFPSFYWQAWSDVLIHRIHNRVLRHIAALAEAS